MVRWYGGTVVRYIIYTVVRWYGGTVVRIVRYDGMWYIVVYSGIVATLIYLIYLTLVPGNRQPGPGTIYLISGNLELLELEHVELEYRNYNIN